MGFQFEEMLVRVRTGAIIAAPPHSLPLPGPDPCPRYRPRAPPARRPRREDPSVRRGVRRGSGAGPDGLRRAPGPARGAADGVLPAVLRLSHLPRAGARGALGTGWAGGLPGMRNAFELGTLGTTWTEDRMGSWFDPEFRRSVETELRRRAPRPSASLLPPVHGGGRSSRTPSAVSSVQPDRRVSSRSRLSPASEMRWPLCSSRSRIARRRSTPPASRTIARATSRIPGGTPDGDIPDGRSGARHVVDVRPVRSRRERIQPRPQGTDGAPGGNHHTNSGNTLSVIAPAER